MSKRNQRPTVTVQRVDQIKPCCGCVWAVSTAGILRCHLNPPQIRLPYDNVSAWPPVPEMGGGCSHHLDKKVPTTLVDVMDFDGDGKSRKLLV